MLERPFIYSFDTYLQSRNPGAASGSRGAGRGTWPEATSVLSPWRRRRRGGRVIFPPARVWHISPVKHRCQNSGPMRESSDSWRSPSRVARVARTPSRRESPGVETACGVREHLGVRAQAAAVCRLLGPRQPGTGSARAREAAAASLRTPPPRPRPPLPPAAGTWLSLASEKAPRAPFSPRTRFWTSSTLSHWDADLESCVRF